MINLVSRNEKRIARHKRIRQNLAGTAQKPRLCVFRSNTAIYVQVIDDAAGNTLCSASSNDKELKLTNKNNIEAATKVGQAIAKKLLAKNIENVVFDRGGYLYHGRVKALAEAAREAGLKF